MSKKDPFKYFHSSPEIIRLAMMLHVRFPLSLRNVLGLLLHERGVQINHKTERFWWHRFAAEIRKRRIAGKNSSRGRIVLRISRRYRPIRLAASRV